MDLKEYLQIIKKNIKLFLAVVVFAVIGVSLFFFSRPVAYDTFLTLNVTRIGSQESSDYQYDNFYRLQADEEFAETIVQWLQSPRVISDILKEADLNEKSDGLQNFSKTIEAQKRSSQVIFVSFSYSDSQSAGKLSDAVKKIISRNTENLNKNQKEDTWFAIQADDPVISKRAYNYPVIILASLMAGIFIGFWVVMVRHYIS